MCIPSSSDESGNVDPDPFLGKVIFGWKTNVSFPCQIADVLGGKKEDRICKSWLGL